MSNDWGNTLCSCFGDITTCKLFYLYNYKNVYLLTPIIMLLGTPSISCLMLAYSYFVLLAGCLLVFNVGYLSDYNIFLSIAGIITYIVPCYTFGKNAEQLGESCLMYALSQMVPILDVWCRTQIRGKIREQKGIEGTCMKDFLLHWFCGLCALIQEARVSWV